MPAKVVQPPDSHAAFQESDALEALRAVAAAGCEILPRALAALSPWGALKPNFKILSLQKRALSPMASLSPCKGGLGSPIRSVRD